MSDYNAVLRETDRAAASGYSYTRQISESKGDIRFSGPDIGSRNDADVVQHVPKTSPVKRYVVIDASQRNWMKQANPYTNLTYTFGKQNTEAYNPIVYSNSRFFPTFASDAAGNLNDTPGRPNSNGWYFNGNFYKPYNPYLGDVGYIGRDLGYTIQPSGLGFGSAFVPINVQSIRLVRALLPQRQFLSIPILVGASNAYDNSNYGAGGVVQKSLGSNGSAYSTFGTYPYLLLKLNEYPGKYVGGNDDMQKAFSVMTQRTRSQTNFQLDIGVQHYDYEPWGGEAMTFQSPVTNLPPLEISVTDPNGNAFIQNDSLTITHIQTDANALFLRCFTGPAQYFNNNELRVGDRVIFDVGTLDNIVKTVAIANNDDKKNLLLALGKTSFPVVQLLDYVTNADGLFVARDLITPPQPRTESYNASFNGFLIPNFLNTDQYGSVTPTYPNAPDKGNYDIVQLPVLYNVNPSLSVNNLPFLNTSLQPTYTLELVCLEPDTSQLGGKITQ